MSNDPLPMDPPDDPDPNPPVGAGRGARRKIVCEFCECHLTETGDALRVSDRARGFRKLEDRIDALKAELEHAQVALAAAESTLSELRAAAARAPEGERRFRVPIFEE